MKLQKLFVMCALQNYASEGNIQHEDFILAATYIGKDRDRQLADKTFWVRTVEVLMSYIRTDENPSLACLCLKLVA